MWRQRQQRAGADTVRIGRSDARHRLSLGGWQERAQRAAGRTAQRAHRAVVEREAQVKTDGGYQHVRISVRRVPGAAEENFLLVSFLDLQRDTLQHKRGRKASGSAPSTSFVSRFGRTVV